MTGDIALIFSEDESQIPFAIPFDLGFSSSDLEQDDGLRTAVIISLFTDRRVTSEEVPIGEQSLRGWWGDLFPDQEGDVYGSRLWLLAREKRTQETLNRAVEYAEEALTWLTEDGIAETLTVDAAYDTNGVLILSISIQKPADDDVSFRFKVKWNTEADRS